MRRTPGLTQPPWFGCILCSSSFLELIMTVAELIELLKAGKEKATMSNNAASPASMQPFVMRHCYRDGRVSVWIKNYDDAMQVWEMLQGVLVEPCLSGPLKTSPSVWRVDYVGRTRNTEIVENIPINGLLRGRR
jgi:hypothetical protein